MWCSQQYYKSGVQLLVILMGLDNLCNNVKDIYVGIMALCERKRMWCVKGMEVGERGTENRKKNCGN